MSRELTRVGHAAINLPVLDKIKKAKALLQAERERDEARGALEAAEAKVARLRAELEKR